MNKYNVTIRENKGKKREYTIQLQAEDDLNAIEATHANFNNIRFNYRTGQSEFGNRISIVKVRRVKE